MPVPGPVELVLILVVVMLIFGVGKLPEVGAGLGKGIREFKDSISGRGDDEQEQRRELENSTTARSTEPTETRDRHEV